MYICISVRITWLVSLGLLGNLSATFFSPISTKASTSFWAVASFPFRRSQRTSTSIQHSLALWKFSFAIISIEAWLNSSYRAKSFHFTPKCQQVISLHESQLLSRGTFYPNQVGSTTLQKIKPLSNLGLNLRLIISASETEIKERCPCSNKGRRWKNIYTFLILAIFCLHQ